MSGDHLPFFGSLEHGSVHYGLGYTGNGVGPAHLGGQILAHRALAKYDDVLALPIVDMEPRRFPPEPIRSVGAAVANRAIHRRDESLDDDARAEPVRRLRREAAPASRLQPRPVTTTELPRQARRLVVDGGGARGVRTRAVPAALEARRPPTS